MQICCLNFTILLWGYSSPLKCSFTCESPHASSGVILKANINQFCIVDCPGAVCNTCSVFAGMDVCRHFSTQTSDDNRGEAAPFWGPSITTLYHMKCTHARPCPTLKSLKNIYLYWDNSFCSDANSLYPSYTTYVLQFSLESFLGQSCFC